MNEEVYQMPDRENVIQRLNHLERYGAFSKDWKQALRDAIALLREQEPVKPIAEGKRPYRWFRCGNCEEPLYGPWNYCQKCGRKVKWDAAD